MIWFRILLGMLGLVTFGYGIRCFHKDHYKSALACLALAAVFLLTDPTSFQGFLKTGIIAKLNSLGRTVDKIQDTLVEQQRSLSAQQEEINTQQEELGAQQTRISSAQSTIATQQLQVLKQQVTLDAQEADLNTMQAELGSTQMRISEQQSKIEDVEFLVQNLFSKTRTEKIAGTDSNRVCHVAHGDNAIRVFFKLSEPAIANSVQGYFDNDPMKPGISTVGNLAWSIFGGSWDTWKGREFSFRYVADTRDGQKFVSMKAQDGKVYLDGTLLPINYEERKSNKTMDGDEE